MLWALAFLVVGAPALWAQQEVEFNYNGRVHVAGTPFSGTGYFKFSLVAGPGRTTIWTNDGTTLDGSEPSSSIATTVTQGFFSVDIGDTSTPNMAALNPSLFNRDDKVYLRSWFSDGTHGFEQMHPDRRVVNPALLGTTSFDLVDLYVDPTAGSDTDAGTEAKPMKTLQNAWNSLPPTLTTTATIHLATGTYYEGVVLSGKSVNNRGRIVILGNPEDPAQVVFKGTDESETTATHNLAVVFEAQTSVDISGLTIMGETYIRGDKTDIRLRSGSEVRISDCVLDHTSISAMDQSAVTVERIHTFFDDRPYNQTAPSGLSTTGVNLGGGSVGLVIDCLIEDAQYGVMAGSNSVLTLRYVTLDDCYFGTNIELVSCASFDKTTTVSNCHNGVMAKTNSALAQTSNLVFSNNEDNDLLLWTGAQQQP